MRTINFLLQAVMAATTVATVLTSCTNDNNDASREASPYITIDAAVGTLTRSTATAFEADDQVSIYAWTGSADAVPAQRAVDNSLNTYDGTKWTATPQMLWQDATTAHYFIGVHPVKVITDFTADTYTDAPDLLVATALGEGCTAFDGIVPLVFDHLMAKLVVNLTFRNQFGGTPTVESVTVGAQPATTVNYLTKTATPDGTATPVAMTAVTANTAYARILAPQPVRTITITITIGGKAYVYNHVTDFALAAGKIQTVNLIVGRDEITLGSVSINDWTTGEIIDGGEALD